MDWLDRAIWSLGNLLEVIVISGVSLVAVAVIMNSIERMFKNANSK